MEDLTLSLPPLNNVWSVLAVICNYTDPYHTACCSRCGVITADGAWGQHLLYHRNLTVQFRTMQISMAILLGGFRGD